MPVNGHALPHTPLAVDFWQVRKCPRARLFFLSHAHSDHTVGLSSTWSHRPIYCSPVSATLLKLKLQVKEQWLHPLELNEPHMLPLDDIGKERLTVTLMDANHCPGAVMFLFQGYFGSILYTGDFRYTPSILREPCLRNNTTIDVLYLDNTNCDPTRTLPSRKTATQQIKEIIRSRPNHNVVIGLYTLGKESLLVELAMEFKTWVEVSFERMETLRALELPDVFTTDRGAGRIRAVDQSEICSANLRRWTTDCPTVAILPTSRPIVSFHPNVHVVPYSDHSSYQELEDFVSALKPTSLVPIVGNCVPGTFSALLPNRKRQEILVPESVRNYMRQPVIQRPQPGYSSFPRRPMGPPPPRGVVFESPVKRSRLSVVVSGEAVDVGRDPPEEETDSDLNEEEADGVLIDLRRDLAPTRRKRNVCDLGLHIVRTIPPDMEMAESVPLSQLSQSNFDSVQIVANTAASLKPVIAFKAEGGADSDAVSSASAASRFSVHRAQQNNMSLFQIGSISGFHNSSKCLTEIQSNCVEETERSLLLLLPFTEEDVRRCGLLDRSLVNRFRLSPCNVA